MPQNLLDDFQILDVGDDQSCSASDGVETNGKVPAARLAQHTNFNPWHDGDGA
jgi:hypothetical protein